MASGFWLLTDEEFAQSVARYRRHPFVVSSSSSVIFGVIVGSSMSSWIRGAIAAVVLFVCIRFVIGAYWLHMSRRSSS
jgi:hypothetical protein